MDGINQFCPYCGTMLDQSFLFCPHCGKSLEILNGIGIGKQISIYLISIFLPPGGIVYGMRYIKSSNQQVKTVGIIAVILTIISLAVSVWFVFDVIKQVQGAMTKYGNLGI